MEIETEFNSLTHSQFNFGKMKNFIYSFTLIIAGILAMSLTINSNKVIAATTIDLQKVSNNHSKISSPIQIENGDREFAQNPKPKKKSTALMWGLLGTVGGLLIAPLILLWGAHRYYLGYGGIGFLQFLYLAVGVTAIILMANLLISTTLGISLGVLALYSIIWVISDLVRIGNGTLKPKNGEYEEMPNNPNNGEDKNTPQKGNKNRKNE